MKKSIIIFALMAAFPAMVSAQKEKADIVKTGLNFGPLPAVAYDADKGFQYGALLNIYNYGDGHNYPNYDSYLYLESSFFTKGSKLFQIIYDNKELIPNTRWSTYLSANLDDAFDFYGYNGYGAFYDHEKIAVGNYSPFYKMKRHQYLFKTDFTGRLTDHIQWEAGYHFMYMNIGELDYDKANKGKAEDKVFDKTQQSLFRKYADWGLITPEEADGGAVSTIRAGIQYDTRDKEGAPSRGIWAEAHVEAAPKWLGTETPYGRYSVTWRQYLPFVKNDVLTLAYRVNYEGTIGSTAPFYMLPFMTVMGSSTDRDGMGGSKTLRGIMRDRISGLDMAAWTAELRWRFVKFQLWNQNIAFGLNAFTDGAMVTRKRDMSFKGESQYKAEYDAYISKASDERPHMTLGGGLRFIMNENFIVSCEYGTPFTHLNKNSKLYNQDGTGALYIGLGYLF